VKPALRLTISVRSAITLLIFVFFFYGAFLSAVFAEDAAKDAASQPASKDTAPRIPVQNIFDTQNAKVEAVADSLEYQKDTGKLIAKGNAIITYQNTKILADYAEIETDAKKVYAKGHVLIFRKGVPRLQGEEIYYDLGNHTGSFPNALAIDGPLYAKGKEIRQVREGVCKIQEGSVTTCKLEKPHYELRCKTATLYLDEKIIMHSVTLYILGTPVFWLPWLDLPLNVPTIPVRFKTGHSTQYGYYLELSKVVAFNKELWGRAHIDWRSKRGFGAGWDQYYDFGKYAHGSIKLYLTQDKDAPTPGYIDPTTGQLNPYAKREDRDRGRITWRHRTDIDDETNILLRYHRAADKYFLQDFAEDEYRSEMQPQSFVTANHNTEQYGAMIHVEKKMNSYESMVERLPEVRLDLKNQPLYKELIYNESRVQFDNLTIRNANSTLHQSAVRTDAYSRWYMPLRWDDFNLTSFAGYRGTEYSQQLNSNASRYRSVIDYGTDLRTHFYRTFDVSFDKMGIEVNQLRHVMVPSVALQGTTSTVSNEKLIHFDTVDSIDDAQQVIFGLENRLQTKRVVNGKSQRVDIVSMNTYMHFATSPMDSTIDGSKFISIDNGLTLRPYEWLQFQTRFEYDLARNYLKFSSNDMLIRKGPWKFVFGFRYMHPHTDWYIPQTIAKSQELVFDLRYQINHLWEVGGYVRYDTATSGIQEYQISAARDLHDFILEFGFNQRNSLVNNNNHELFVDFHMKGVPSLNVKAGGGRSTFSEPRIGETVAGANEGAGRYGSATMADSFANPLIDDHEAPLIRTH
jgi:lipopolysaccharide assembly outer membrane protein LptD (OstA)